MGHDITKLNNRHWLDNGCLLAESNPNYHKYTHCFNLKRKTTSVPSSHGFVDSEVFYAN